MLLEIIIIVIVLAVVCAVAARRNRKRRSEVNMLRRQFLESHSAPRTEDIFVPLLCQSDAPTLAGMIVELFHKAYAPARIFVGVVEYGAVRSTVDVLRDHYPEEFDLYDLSNHVRVMSLNADKYRGPYLGKHFAFSTLYKGEAFTLQVRFPLLCAPFWDQHLLFQFKLLRNQVPGDERRKDLCLLSWRPPRFGAREEDICSFDHITDATDFDCFLKTDAIRTKPLFPAFQRWDDLGFPQWQWLAPAQTPTRLHPSGIWSHNASFSKSHLFTTLVPYDPYMLVDGQFAHEDTVMTTRLFTAGVRFFLPLISVFHSNEVLETISPPAFTEDGLLHASLIRQRLIAGLSVAQQEMYPSVVRHLGRFGLGRSSTLSDLALFTGVDIKARVAFVRGYFGVTKGASNEELVNKFGSVEAYEKMRQALL